MAKKPKAKNDAQAQDDFINELTGMPMKELSQTLSHMLVEGRTMDDANKLMTAMEIFIERKVIEIVNGLTLDSKPPFVVPSAEKEDEEDFIGMSGYLNRAHMEEDRAAYRKSKVEAKEGEITGLLSDLQLKKIVADIIVKNDDSGSNYTIPESDYDEECDISRMSEINAVKEINNKFGIKISQYSSFSVNFLARKITEAIGKKENASTA